MPLETIETARNTRIKKLKPTITNRKILRKKVSHIINDLKYYNS